MVIEPYANLFGSLTTVKLCYSCIISPQNNIIGLELGQVAYNLLIAGVKFLLSENIDHFSKFYRMCGIEIIIE